MEMAKRGTYHHGNLREALLRAGVEMIGEGESFTLREVARRAGVSHNAPYRHFPDKDALLAAIAAQGFDELTEAMRQAAGRHRAPLERLRSSGLAYIDFALRRSEHFRVMFETPAADLAGAAREAGARAFGTLVEFVGECQKHGKLPGGDTKRLALVAWSLVHGVAKLAVSGHFPGWTKGQVLEFAGFAMAEALEGKD